MALVQLDDDDIKELGINSFDTETGSLGVGFVFQNTFVSEDGLLVTRTYKPTDLDSPYPLIYATSQGAAVSGGVDYPAYILQKDV